MDKCFLAQMEFAENIYPSVSCRQERDDARDWMKYCLNANST